MMAKTPELTDFLSVIEKSPETFRDIEIPDELMSVERLEQYAATFAQELKVEMKAKRNKSLRPLLKGHEQTLLRSYRILAKAIQNKETVSPAAEWFVDNFHLVEAQLREIKTGLPDHYYNGLPQLVTGELKSYPRVYAIASSYVSHTDGNLDTTVLQRFLGSFQTSAPLTIGELWALVITLRFVMIQNIAGLAERIISSRENRTEADKLADHLLSYAITPGVSDKDVIRVLQTEVLEAGRFNRPFIVQLLQRLRDQDPALLPAFDWIEKELNKRETTTQRVTQLELKIMARAQVTIGNILGSIRLLTTHDWRAFVEEVNLIDPVLRKDPVGAYALMNFQTRDQYRHVIEGISRRSPFTEKEIAQRAIAAASTGQGVNAHVGFYLLGKGKKAFRGSCQYRPYLKERIYDFILAHPTPFYLGTLLVFMLVLMWAVLDILGPQTPLVKIGFAILALFPVSELSLSFLNHYCTFFIQPAPLPRMDDEKGLPEDAETMVVIPTLLSSEKSVRELVERLEIHALANQDSHLSFALLTDFKDSTCEEEPQDKSFLHLALTGIQNLNDRYYPNAEPRFHLFHRKRLWNESEGAFIGWERKRGKLLEFNQLLRGSTTTSYTVVTADNDFLSRIKYVITLDSDSQLPREAARKLVATILHPLNQPVFDEKTRHVVEGYGILQPRVSITLESGRSTRFARISSGNIGIDPYTTAVSDVYQDLFREGSFTGKGLYVVDAFEKAMEGRVPENAVLSHDLFEGSFARSALVTDVELFDDYPEDFETYNKRGHRWTRGDWQIIGWLFPRVRDAHGNFVRNDLSLISRWKIFDNLRRSLVPVATLLWLSLAWTLLPGSPVLWTFLIALMFLFPIYSTVATGQWMQTRGLTWHGHFLGGLRETKLKLSQIFITIAFLPKEAWSRVDAIVRALYRMTISHRSLLEWTSFAQLKTETSGNLKFLDVGPVFSLVALPVVLLVRPETAPVALPFLTLWFLNPLIKKWLSDKPIEKAKPLTTEERAEYRAIARRTWSFFETFWNEQNHWLMPDNFQEEPRPVVAHRTSPTNVGLQFLAGISAYDLGYIGKADLVKKIRNTFDSLARLETLNGHFYNWYDTKSLTPLHPRYISTVDSGNLAGHLLTLRQFLVELKGSRLNPNIKVGLEDSLAELLSHPDLDPELKRNLAQISEMVRKENFHLHLPILKQFADEATAIGGVKSSEETRHWIHLFRNQIESYAADLEEPQGAIDATIEGLIPLCEKYALGMDFKFLYDRDRKLFVIGFNVQDNRLDNSYYDLLASESRLASFVAIAKGDVPQDHWFHLGRRMTQVKEGRALIAWTATMFEYLMPVLVMKNYPDTLLDETYLSVLKRQMDYGLEKGVPWGVSEAGYYARDLQMNYQYGPFGIPGLGLKRGLSDELVISPYSTLLASMVDPREALTNLRRLMKIGAYARFGFYESIDYTAERLPAKQKFAILKSFMAHHQGMSLVSIGNVLNDFAMARRFHAHPMVTATELILKERVPQKTPLTKPREEEVRSDGFLFSNLDVNPRLYSDINLSLPRTQLLSNGTYSVMVTSTGAGYSKSGPLSISRWREDPTRDHWGQFIFVRNRKAQTYWSVTHQPTLKTPDHFGVTFSEDKVEYWRKDGTCLTNTTILVSPEDNVELRKVTVTNQGATKEEFEFTSFMELVMARPNDDAAHPAFSNLFVQTEFENGALLATRRARKNGEHPPWCFHLVSSDKMATAPTQYETDRSRFIGRGKSAGNPMVLEENRPLSNTTGSVLDPAFSLRTSLELGPGESASVVFVTGICPDKSGVLHLIDKYRDPHLFRRESELAWTQSQVQLRHLNLSNAKAHVYQRLAGRILYLDSSLRPAALDLSQNKRTQQNLWAYGISGDLPIVLTQISDEKDMSMVTELLHAHEYLRLKGLVFDLVILNERSTSYLQDLQDEIHRQVRMSGSQNLLDKAGGIFLRRRDLIPPDDLVLLRSVAKVILNAQIGTLEDQLKYRKPRNILPPALSSKAQNTQEKPVPFTEGVGELKFFNGVGGFTQDAREYVITLAEEQMTPAPWINVIANASDFGFTVSESGSGYTWSVNSRENRITPWSNDPVMDPPGEALYIRDEETGEFWSPTPLPVREKDPYVIRHGQGYTTFTHQSHNIHQTLTMSVDTKDSVKISRLILTNVGTRRRKLSVTSYLEWVLGFSRSTSAPFIIPEFDEDSGAIFARNPYNNEFAHRVSFVGMSEKEKTFTCDRREFLGRNGSPGQPAALYRTHLSSTTGAGLDPCAAFQTKFDLAPGEEKTIIVILGQADSAAEARHLAQAYLNLDRAEISFDRAGRFWEDTLKTLTIETPDEAMNTLVNRWLLYQTLACRVWARSAFYQSGGAFGYRDQLQDVMAVAYSHPEITRKQILTSAARQFKEGDVQHWWHPPTGRGVRTHFSDDLIWLPLVVAHYVRVTGDKSILDEVVPFIEAPLLSPGQEDSYTHPQISNDTGTIFEHCARALDRSLKTGRHGLPLMGAGDWNDGMNRVGHEGQGESVWVAWFLISTLKDFLPYCESRNEDKRAAAYRAHVEELKTAIEKNAWDGDWYKRAFFDDGTPLGSAQNEECRIDSISQSWSVLSGAGDPGRAKRAMQAVDEYLIHRGDGLIKLFAPPFDKTNLDPGYIKGYVPGVRENGGQYTHAAIWTMMAFAELGDGDRAGELYALLNPINHASTRAGLYKYKVEPYVVAADIYGLYPHVGRGGWTWYTGSASWMYRSAIETLLGFSLKGNRVTFAPKVPQSWREFKLTYKNYDFTVIRSEEAFAEVDGVRVSEILLEDDQKPHKVTVRFK